MQGNQLSITLEIHSLVEQNNSNNKIVIIIDIWLAESIL